MANTGKFIDRNPQVVTAGFRTPEHAFTTKDCLEYASLEDKVTALKHEAGITEEKPKYPIPKIDSQRYWGFETHVKKIFHEGLKPPFQHMEDEMKETTYSSYWKSPIGKTRDPIPGLPEGTDPMTKIFGIPPKRELTVAELVNPDKLPGQVLFESNLGHELYLKSHQDYYAAEHVNRGYNPPGFNPEATFGMSIKADFTGKNVNRDLKWINNDNTCEVSARLADFLKERRSNLGKTYEPSHVLEKCVPEDHTFGMKTKQTHGVAELMKESKPSATKKDLLSCIMHINAIRHFVNKHQPPFDYEMFFRALKQYDKDDKGWIPLDAVHKICDNFEIQAQKEMLEEFMKHSGIMDCNCGVDYEKFSKLINLKYQLPAINKINDVPPENLHFESTYQGFLHDMKSDNSGMKPAGLPTFRTDVAHTVTECRSDKGNLGDETDVRALISPSIFTQYGLSHRNLFKPHNKVTIHNIFHAIGVDLPDDIFEAIWNESYKCDNTGGVCIETFRNFLDKMATQHTAL